MSDPRKHAVESFDADPAPTAFALWRAAVIPGLLLVAVGVPAVIASGRLPETAVLFVAIGGVVASITGALGCWLKCRAVAAPYDPQGHGPNFQAAILGDFVINLLLMGFTVVGMMFAKVEFASVAGLAITFASVFMIQQLLSGMVIARALRRRAISRSHPSTAESGS